MLKCIGLTALATAVAMLTLGCVGGSVSPTAPVQDQIYMAKPMSAPAGIISREATVLWRDIGIYRASGPLEEQLHERHDAGDFATKTQDKVAARVP